MNETTLLIIISAALAVSELLSLIPKLKSNSIFTLTVNILRWIKEKLSK